jgi:DNA-binding NtrC family response regulator
LALRQNLHYRERVPTNWGRGKAALLIGADGGALGGIADAVRGVGFRTVAAFDGVKLAKLLDEEHVAVVYLDAEITSKAMATLRELRVTHPELPVIFVRASPSPTEVADAVRAGVFDFLPVGAPTTTLLARLHDAVTQAHDSANVLVASSESAIPGPGGMLGASAPMKRLFSMIERVARFKTSVLVLGESGAGKELVARAIHQAGPRKDQPFVPVNCATLGKELLENELFGHERGAFTGAHTQKKGLLELADGGTIFLDEIGEMDSSTQAKLLRVLERSELRRVGGTTKLKINVNVVAATNQDLRTAIASGRFREDLFYRLRVVTIVVPPLREHREDIPALVASFIADFNQRNGGKIRGVTPEAMRRLMQHSWPGNVRELKNVIDSGAMLADADLLEEGLLEEAVGGPSVQSPRAAPTPWKRVGPRGPDAPRAGTDRIDIELPARLADVEREVILRTVERVQNRRRAARELGIGLRTLYAKLRAYGHDPDDER